MNLRHIEVFHALMRSSSMTEAARRLHVSQPAVSTVLKHAEQRLGLKLFERTGGRLVPTPEAIALFPEVEHIFARLEALSRSAQGLRDAASGVLSVAAAPTLANALLPATVAAFTAERPRLRVQLRALPTRLVVSGVRDRAFDLGLVYEPAAPIDADIVAEPVGSFCVACVMQRTDALAERPQVAPEDLRGRPLISFGPDTPFGSRLAAAFDAAGVPFEVRVESTASAISVRLVAAGAGVALVDSRDALGGAFPTLTVRDFLPRIESRVLLLHARDRPRSRLAAAFARKLADVAKLSGESSGSDAAAVVLPEPAG
ncbi:MAG TPA: LysR substrate-binding domain-containing protein [Falsiroseomonas sp.]|nr:LysR substrate-binding domain-containing protein [Falsiroseomonas sp.]